MRCPPRPSYIRVPPISQVSQVEMLRSAEGPERARGRSTPLDEVKR